MLLSFVSVVLSLTASAQAGALVVDSTVAAEVRLGELRIAHTYGPGQVRVPDLDPGEHTLTVFRGAEPTTVRLEIPEEGEAWLRISEQGITGDRPLVGPELPEPPVDGPPPRVELQAVSGRGFTVIIDGEIRGTLSKEAPMLLEDLAPGRHELQLRSLDRTVIWARGVLDLQTSDRIVLHAREGRTVEAFGRAEAWQDDQ